MFAIITGINQSLSSAVICGKGDHQVQINRASVNWCGNNLRTKKDNEIFVRREKKLKWRALNLSNL